MAARISARTSEKSKSCYQVFRTYLSLTCTHTKNDHKKAPDNRQRVLVIGVLTGCCRC